MIIDDHQALDGFTDVIMPEGTIFTITGPTRADEYFIVGPEGFYLDGVSSWDKAVAWCEGYERENGLDPERRGQL